MRTVTVEKTYKDLRFVVERHSDDDPDLSWLDQNDKEMGEGFEAESRKRKEAYADGDWFMEGIVVKAELIDIHGMEETLVESCWGIESDSEDSHFTAIENECKRELVDRLNTMGIPADFIREHTGYEVKS